MGQLPEIIANRKAAVGLIDKLVLSLSGNTHSNEEKISIPPRLSDGITLNNLSFGYEENKLVLQDINIKFETGKSYMPCIPRIDSQAMQTNPLQLLLPESLRNRNYLPYHKK